ncbi:Putative protein [Zobellia galactanivorans]|uniref:Uncharacterized protein n=1 Tax=Zobellia galactanivorans (strain DSM 12802 / CCUG 47099 / CIP 106680 / NCIMB 13871 / Dsij) TaxID=63186 RepID=G0LAC2_ZOBGA|nr:hypothetical protein B4Q04_00950 [Zobellia sp. OII3]CAZ95220.1 Putative protein [Zobellia galactanivorans]
MHLYKQKNHPFLRDGFPVRHLDPTGSTDYFFLGAAFGAAFLPDFAGEGLADGLPAFFACAIVSIIK